VAISGPRQSGKTTLARRFARQGRNYLTLDNQPTLAADSCRNSQSLSPGISYCRSSQPAPEEALAAGAPRVIEIKTARGSEASPWDFLHPKLT
jgi:hypothetical protein